tara:strand:+ start:5101 stop:5634 length:534 start_codon:yes stop_codon:yes gene_type:complete
MSEEWTDEEPEDIVDVIVKSDSEGEEEEAGDEDEGGIEAKPEPKPKAVKPKRKMSEKQLQALAAGRAKRDAGRNERKSVRDEKAAIRKTNLEKRTIKKAIALKKREAIEEAALLLSDEDSVDELEVKQVKRLVAKRKARAKAKPVKVKTRFAPASKDYSPERPQRPASPEPPQYTFY